MLLYSNTAFWRIVFEPRGSLVLRCRNIAFSLLVALATLALTYLRSISSPFMEHLSPRNNVGWNMMGTTIVFALVFRTNLGWQRYWEALGQLQLMYSKWADAFTQCVGFVNVTVMQKNNESEEQFLRDKLGILQRNFSLLSAFAAHRLTHGDVHRMEKRCELARWKDQIILRRELRTGGDLTGATELPGFSKVTRRSQLNSNLENSWFGDYCVTDVPSPDELELLTEASDRVHAVMYWVIHDLSEISQKLSIAPPIQSRMYQELSNGMLGFQNAIKMADVPFPFQFTQLFNYLVLAFSIFIPIYASTFTGSPILSPLIAYVVHLSLLVINQVAIQLETPFGTECNDISIKDFHARFVENIIEINPIGRYKCQEMTKAAEESLPERRESFESDQSPRRGGSGLRRGASVLVEALEPSVQRDSVDRTEGVKKAPRRSLTLGDLFGSVPNSNDRREKRLSQVEDELRKMKSEISEAAEAVLIGAVEHVVSIMSEQKVDILESLGDDADVGTLTVNMPREIPNRSPTLSIDVVNGRPNLGRPNTWNDMQSDLARGSTTSTFHMMRAITSLQPAEADYDIDLQI